MRALAGYIVKGPASVVLVMVISTLLGLLAPPLTSLIIYIGGGALALYTLYTGSQSGLLVLTAAAAVLIGVSLLVIHQALPGVVMLVYWLPVWLAAMILRNLRDLAWAVMALTGVLSLVVIMVFLFLGDPEAWWSAQLQPLADLVSRHPDLGVGADQMQQLIEQMPRVMTGLIAAGLLFACLVSLLLGRWWQSQLVHPGGLRQEFHAFRLQRQLALAGVALVIVASLQQGGFSSLALQLLLVLMVPFLLSGLAVIHAVFAGRGIHRGWLIGLYVLMTLLPQVLMMVVALGALDPWLDLRGRAGKI